MGFHLMKKRSLVITTIILSYLIVENSIAAGGAGCFWLREYHVHITNRLPNKNSLTVHCKSKDKDLGPHIFKWTKKFNGISAITSDLQRCIFVTSGGVLTNNPSLMSLIRHSELTIKIIFQVMIPEYAKCSIKPSYRMMAS